MSKFVTSHSPVLSPDRWIAAMITIMMVNEYMTMFSEGAGAGSAGEACAGRRKLVVGGVDAGGPGALSPTQGAWCIKRPKILAG
jgi:hypothetical protein